MPPRNDRDRSAASSQRPARVHERDLVRVCGLAAVQALIARDPGRVERLFFEASLADALTPAQRAMARARRPYRQVEAAELAKIAGTVRHGGVVAVARPQPLLPLAAGSAAAWATDGRPLLILDGIGNPHNLGAIARNAAFFGIERMILAERAEQALPSDASYRVAEGGLDWLSLYRAALPGAFVGLRPAYQIVGAAAEGGLPPAAIRADKRPVALVLGNEENGLDPATAPACDRLVSVPGSARMQSLNVAVAAAILLYALTGA